MFSAGDTWFYVEGTPLRPLSELITTYHNSVGMNTVMELDFAIDRTGQVRKRITFAPFYTKK